MITCTLKMLLFPFDTTFTLCVHCRDNSFLTSGKWQVYDILFCHLFLSSAYLFINH